MSANRALTLLLLLLALLVAGCGGDDSDDSSSGGPTVAAAEDPATVLPAGAPIVVRLNTDLDSAAVQDAIAFANRVEPSNRDFKVELLKALNSDGAVQFDTDIKPWLGATGMIAIDGVEGADHDITGVLAVPTSDEAATQAALDKDKTPGKPATYKGVSYTVDDDGNAQGVFNGFLIAASDEQHLQAAIDAGQGAGSLADDAKYQETLALAPDDPLLAAYLNVDGLVGLLKNSGSLPAGMPDLSEIPGFQPGQTAIASLAATGDSITVETATTADVPDQGDGPSVADLPGEAWLAVAGALKGEDFTAGLQEGLKSSGLPPEASQMIEQLGLVEFLGSLDSVSMRFGGDSIMSINGQVSLGGDDQAAASKLLKNATTLAQAAAAQQGLQIDVNGDTATLSAGPYKVELTAEDGDLKLNLGDQPSAPLGDDQAFKVAEEELGLSDGKIAGYMDFALLQKFLESLPQDQQLAEGLKVISQLGSLAIGTGKEGDATIARAVLTLR